MLYYLFTPLKDNYIAFNLFRYISFRAASSAVLALLISLFIGPLIIRWLKKLQLGEEIRTDGPQSHQVKRGTPSMGGLIIIISVVVPTFFLAKIGDTFVWLILLVTIALGALGWLDDYLKIVKKKPKGLVGRYKLAGQITLGLLVGCIIYFFPAVESARSSTTLPFFKNYELHFGVFYIAVVAFVLTATSNSSNLTDGLDGLLIGLVAIAALAFGAIAYLTGRVDFAHYLNIIYLPGAGELSIYCAALFGAALGFLWYNAHPAEVFMGDTGSLALGGAIATVAILIKKEL
ncbi:MAG: phospho-N-acetylmuramoyl-pentapeptide-transferase, partial [Actinobacteria bacterium]|nr:phospho-N-acetylmuramoyl-pentapeptide-transferase [Actinomycetota bacterium]